MTVDEPRIEMATVHVYNHVVTQKHEGKRRGDDAGADDVRIIVGNRDRRKMRTDGGRMQRRRWRGVDDELSGQQLLTYIVFPVRNSADDVGKITGSRMMNGKSPTITMMAFHGEEWGRISRG